MDTLLSVMQRVVTMLTMLSTHCVRIAQALSDMAASVCAPSEQGSAYKQYKGLFHMVEEKLEWIGSKCDILEQRSMCEAYTEHHFNRVMHMSFLEWNPSMDEHYFARQFEQEYHLVWMSRRRFRTKWSPKHERLCMAQLLWAVHEHAPDTEYIDKIELLLSNGTWNFLAPVAWDRYALMCTMHELETELMGEDHSEPEVNLK